jgi:hypothetical protein
VSDPLQDIYEQYTCVRCGEYGDSCGCGPAAYGCTFQEECSASWHLHQCPEENGDCDRPEEHTIAADSPRQTLLPPPPPGGHKW